MAITLAPPVGWTASDHTEAVMSRRKKDPLRLGCPIWSDFEPLFSCWFWALVHVAGTGRSQHRALFLLRGTSQVFIEPPFDILGSNRLQCLAKEVRRQGGHQQRYHQDIRRDLPAGRLGGKVFVLAK